MSDHGGGHGEHGGGLGEHGSHGSGGESLLGPVGEYLNPLNPTIIQEMSDEFIAPLGQLLLTSTQEIAKPTGVMEGGGGGGGHGHGGGGGHH